MAKDKRAKGCYNLSCQRYRKEYKYKATDNFCTICGEKLVYVCTECFDKIEDQGPEVRLCPTCEAKHEERRAKVQAGKNTAVNVVKKSAAVAPAIVKAAKDPKVKEAAVKVIGKVIKK